MCCNALWAGHPLECEGTWRVHIELSSGSPGKAGRFRKTYIKCKGTGVVKPKKISSVLLLNIAVSLSFHSVGAFLFWEGECVAQARRKGACYYYLFNFWK